jgi:hypothetical protein
LRAARGKVGEELRWERLTESDAEEEGMKLRMSRSSKHGNDQEQEEEKERQHSRLFVALPVGSLLLRFALALPLLLGHGAMLGCDQDLTWSLLTRRQPAVKWESAVFAVFTVSLSPWGESARLGSV